MPPTNTSVAIVLPSGRRVRVRPAVRRSRPRPASDTTHGLFGGAVAALDAGELEVKEGGRPLGRDAIRALDLADFHVLRDAAIRAGLVASEPEEVACENCDRRLAFDPGALDLDDLAERYADVASPREARVPLASALPAPRGGRVDHAVLVRPTLAEALPLHRTLAEADGFQVTPSVLRGMGVARLEGPDGARVEVPAMVARVLRRASDAVWAGLEARVLEHLYPAAAVAPLVCPDCETLHEMEVPWPRELDPGAYAPPRDAEDEKPFWTPEAFEDAVEQIGGEVFAEQRVSGLTLRVETGPASTDLGGSPLLGSYTPSRDVDDAGYTRLEFLVTVYYRTFARQWADEGPFDVEGEIRETIRHEVEHHLHHLAGHDPLDEAERAEAERDVARVAGGRRKARRLAARALAGDVVTFGRATWPVFALLALALALAAWLSPGR